MKTGRIGAYEIRSLLGAGGMGEVYRAHDPKLGREVAIKVLPATFANDPERLRRFEREARALAALSHPHIAAIYGVEEADGVEGGFAEIVVWDEKGNLVGSFPTNGMGQYTDEVPAGARGRAKGDAPFGSTLASPNWRAPVRQGLIKRVPTGRTPNVSAGATVISPVFGSWTNQRSQRHAPGLTSSARRYLAWESIVAEKEKLNLDHHQSKQAETQREAASSAVTARLPETYQWLLVPTQKKDETTIEWQALRLTGGQEPLAVRAPVSRFTGWSAGCRP